MSVGYEKTLLLYNNAILDTSDIISTYVYRYGIENMNYSYSTAVGLFNSVINVILVLSTNYISKKVSDNSRLLQLAEIIEAREDDDVIMINLPEYLKSKRDVGKLYYQTDTHWNTLGAYFGYYQLMSAIAETYPNCKPHELSDFTITTNTTRVGDLLNFSQIGSSAAETNTECHKNFKTATSRMDTLSQNGGTTTVNDDTLPSAVIMRDSFGSAIYSFMAEHFSTMTFTPYNGGLTNALNYVKDVQPDYFIQILVERNIGGLLGE